MRKGMISWAGRQEHLNSSYWRRVWDLVYPWLVYQGVVTLVMMALSAYLLITQPQILDTIQGLGDSTTVLNELMQKHYVLIALLGCAFTIPLLLLFIKKDRQKEQREAFQMEHWQRTGFLSFFLCFLLGISSCIVLNHVLIYSGLYDLLAEGFEDTAQTLYQGRLLPELISIGILTPVVEELLFRGLAYRRIRWYLDALPAMLVSALLFAVFHGNLLQGIYAFTMGLLMAFVYERTHHILAPICVHVGGNLLSVLFSDIPGLGRIYDNENETAFLLLTAAMMLLFTAAFYLFYTRVHPSRVEKQAKEPAYLQGNKEEDKEENDGTRTI